MLCDNRPKPLQMYSREDGRPVITLRPRRTFGAWVGLLLTAFFMVCSLTVLAAGALGLEEVTRLLSAFHAWRP